MTAGIEDYVYAFEDAWQSGTQPEIEDHLAVESEQHEEVLSELAHIDFEYRLKAGENIRVESYLQRFPELNAPETLLSLAQLEFTIRRRCGDSVSLDEFVERFPQHRDSLTTELSGTGVEAVASTVRSLHCPHCHERLPTSSTSAAAETVCSACGSAIDLRHAVGATELPNLGRFQLLHPVGQGAFGRVYKALDTQLDRIVAAKIPRSGGLASEEDEERFIREARSVAQLNHPGIVALHEVGRADGVPFLVTDFVDGSTLADVLTSQTFSFREAAIIVLDIAEALQHAHSRGVVHRDLKPSNVMLTPVVLNSSDGSDDGSTVSGLQRSVKTHLMDFGLARRDQADVTMTIEGQILGTPAYMSPEQARGEQALVDERTDIYSLGAILYELLTTERPFRGSSRMLIQQVIHDPPPSPRTLNGNISRDLETITLRCLEKSPSARYQTAAELSEDLRRWLNHQPILARPVSKLERAVRWCSRNSTIATLSGALLLSLVGGLALVTWKWLDAEHQRELTEIKRVEAERVSGAANRVQQLYNGVLEQVQIRTSDGDDIELKELLADASAQLDRESIGDGIVKGYALVNFGYTYWFLNMLDEAEQHMREGVALHRDELGREDVTTVRSEIALAEVLRWRQQWAEAQELLEHAITFHTTVSGPDANVTLSTRNILSELHRDKGDTQTALELQRDLYQDYLRWKQTEHSGRLTSANNLGALYVATGNNEAAAELFKEVLAGRLKSLGEWNELTATAYNNLGVVSRRLGDLARAEELYRKALEIDVRVLGADHPGTLYDMHNLANVLSDVGKYAEAIDMFEDVVNKRRASLGSDDPNVAASRLGLMLALQRDGQFAAAESHARDALRIVNLVYPDHHYKIREAEGSLGELLIEWKRFPEAEAILLESVRMLQSSDEVPVMRVESGIRRLIKLYEQWNRPQELRRWQEQLAEY
jgi:serine/threonine protein kinase/tetratricopeptide (TPR) repeat protein